MVRGKNKGLFCGTWLSREKGDWTFVQINENGSKESEEERYKYLISTSKGT